MDNYTLKIYKDEEFINPDLYYFIDFFDLSNNKFASFNLDLIEICDETVNFKSFMKLKQEDKFDILNKFIDNLVQKKSNISLNFIMENGDRIIQINGDIMTFRISSMSMSCEFNVKITEQLIKEFQKIKRVF